LNWPIRKGGWYRIERSVSLAPGTWEEVQRFYAPFSTATTQSGGYDPSTKAHLPDPYPPHLPMTHAPFSSADPRKQIPFSPPPGRVRGKTEMKLP
jgi:hypothetical protein